MGRALLVIDLTAELVIIVPLLCRIIL